MSRIDLTFTQSGNATEVQRVITNIANSGDEVHLAAGTFNWAAAVTNAGKNLSIFGAGPGLTILSGSKIFNITNQLNSTLMRVSGFTFVQNADSDLAVAVAGTAVVDENTFTGGFRLDHCIFTTGGARGNTVTFGGWIEGVVDHCIWERQMVGATNPGGGETFIINHNTSPTGLNVWNFGDYSWANPAPWGSVHQLYIEDCILHRFGGTDTNQFANGGGSIYASRHCTSWTQIVGGHGSREGGGAVTGHRASEAYKNLWVRNAAQDALSNGNFGPVRSGDIVAWGNRYNAWGVSLSAATTPFVLYSYYSNSEPTGNDVGGPNGMIPFDLNQKDPITVNGALHPLDSLYTKNTLSDTSVFPLYRNNIIAGKDQSAQRGDVYAHGVGGSRTTNNNFILPTGSSTTTNFSYGGTNHWADFVLINLELNPVRTTSSMQISWAYIDSSSAANGLHVTNPITSPGSEFAINGNLINMHIGAGDHWEIRRVERYFLATGAGAMDTALDSSAAGPHAARLRGSTTPNPRWTHTADDGGAWQWENKYKILQANSFSPISGWDAMGGTQNAHQTRNRIDGVKPGYNYTATAGSSGNQNTRVGADDEVWAFAPPALLNEASVQSGAADSFYDTGVGGFTYPHPLTQPGGAGTPSISGNGSATISTSKSGANTITKFTANNFSGAVTWGLFDGTWPSNITLTSDTDPLLTATTGVLKTTSNFASGNSAGNTDVTIRAQTSGGAQRADKTFRLTITSPNVAPTDVAITKPSDGDTFTAPATITLESTATDSDGSIASMQYFRGGTTSIATVDATLVASPYQYVWTQVPAGTYSLTVKATDNQTGTTTSPTAISITVNTAPTGLTAPTISVTA